MTRTMDANAVTPPSVALLGLLLDGLDPVGAAVELQWSVAYTRRLAKRLGYPSIPAMRAALAAAAGETPQPLPVAVLAPRPRRSPLAKCAALVASAESHAQAAALAAQEARYELTALSHDLAATPRDLETRATAAALIARLSALTSTRPDVTTAGVAS